MAILCKHIKIIHLISFFSKKKVKNSRSIFSYFQLFIKYVFYKQKQERKQEKFRWQYTTLTRSTVSTPLEDKLFRSSKSSVVLYF